MPNITLSPTAVGPAGASESPTTLNAVDTYFVRNVRRVVLHFKNTNAGAATVVIVTAATLAGFAVADQSVNIPGTTGDVFVALGALPSVFNDANADITFTQDLATLVTCAVLELD